MSIVLTRPVSAAQLRAVLDQIVYSDPAIIAQIDALFPTNGMGRITALVLRQFLETITPPSYAGTINANLPSKQTPPISAATLQAVLNGAVAARVPPGTFQLGVNLAGLENAAFPEPTTTAELAYWIAMGISTFRLPITWVRAQPTPGGALDTATYLPLVAGVLSEMIALGATALLDMHNFGDGPDGTPVGGSTVSVDDFGDLWSKMAGWLISNNLLPAIRGLDLMNEWVNGFDSGVVFAANQAAITAARLAGFTGRIYIEGTNYSGAWNWVSGEQQPFNNAGLYQLVDPLNNLTMSAHSYLDRDSSGTHFVWAIESTTPGLSPPGDMTSHAIGVQRLTPFVNWISAHALKGHLGETGSSSDALALGGNDDFADWNIALDNEIAFAQAANMEVDVWGAGPEFPTSYGFCLAPTNVVNPAAKDFTSAGLQATQTVILQKYSGYAGPQPTAYRIDLPIDGNYAPIRYCSVGVASGLFRVRYNGVIPPGGVTITPYAHFIDGTDAGGAFSPASILLPEGDNAVATFTYTAATPGTLQVSATNNAGWTNPPPLGLSSLLDNFSGLAVTPPNIWNPVRRTYWPYIGPALRLQRAGDNAQMDFTLNVRGDLPRQAIQDWASARLISVVRIYDVSGHGNDMVFGGTLPTLTLVNALGYPEITWPFGLIVSFSSPSLGQGQQSIVIRYNATNSNIIISQDDFLETFRLNGTTYSVSNNGGTVYGVATGGVTATWEFVVGTWSNAYPTNNLKAYLNGALHAQANTAAISFNPSGSDTEFGGFRFGGNNWQGSWQEGAIIYDELSSTVANAFASDAATYYVTPLPDPLSAVSPTIGGTGAGAVLAGLSSTPFANITIADQNSGSPTDSLTITLSGTGAGTLAGTGLIGSGPYSMASASAATLQANMRALVFTPSSGNGTSITFAVAVTSSAGPTHTDSGTVIAVIIPAAAETPYPAPPLGVTPPNYWGVNMAGAEQQIASTRPYGFDYFYPQNGEIGYYGPGGGQGFGLIRLPINIRRVQLQSYGALNQSTGGPTDPPLGQCGEIKRILDYCNSIGMWVVLDPHNFGVITNTYNNLDSGLIGVSSEATAEFVDFWTRLATKFKNYPNVIFGLMNEPNQQTAAQWKTGAVAAINAIAAVTTARLVTIPGTSFTGAHSWVSSGNGAAWAGYVPPSGLPIVYEMHQYLDSDSSGTHAACVSFTTALNAATSWAQTNGVQIFLGEMGWSLDASCLTPGAAVCAYLKANAAQWMGGAYWVGGTYLFYKAYMYIPVTYAPGSSTVPNGNNSQLTDWLTLI